MKYTPYPYQAFAEKFVLEHKAAGLFLDMGLGKTAITLSACEKLLRDYFETSKVLVIAPLLPARETWPDELAKWDQLEGLTYSLIIGTAQERIDALHTDADFYIVNRENVVWLVDYYKKKWPFDMVVIDELSSFKSSKAQRFRALRKVRKYIDRIVGLTGTPAPNGLLDLWSQVYLLDEGARLGRTLSAYRDTYFTPGRRGPNGIIYDWNLKDGAREAIFAKLSDLCISMETTGLPERLTIPHEVKLSEKAAAMYQQLERTMLLPFADGDVDAATAAILTNKLLQLAGGAVYDENGKAQIVHDQKLEVLNQLIEEANGQPVLVFYNYKHELDRLQARYPQAVHVKEENVVKRWNAKEIPILLANPASAGHGLNLQFGGHIAIWYSCDYGTLNPCVFGLWRVNGNSAFMVKEYYYDGRKKGKQKTDEEYYADLEAFADGYLIEQVVIDPSAASFKETIRRHGKFSVKNAKNDVLDGIRDTGTMLQAGLLHFNKTCVNTKAEFGAYAWDEKSSSDAVIKENDHSMDQMRYFVRTIMKREVRAYGIK